jgi:hypothetical protein
MLALAGRPPQGSKVIRPPPGYYTRFAKLEAEAELSTFAQDE